MVFTRIKYGFKRIFKELYRIVRNFIQNLLFLLEIFLFARLSLKFLNANPSAPIVSFIYKYSEILISPFKFIFSDIYYGGRLIDVVTLSAMIGWALFVFIIFKILDLFFGK